MFFIRLRTFFILPAVLVVVGFAGSAGAQTEGASNVISTRTEPPAAAPVATGSHDADGLLVVRAMRLPERLLMDGRLDESAYLQVLPVSGFVQAEPRFDEPATEQTQLWVFFDDDAIYVGIRCFDSDISRWSSLDMRRDSLSFSQGESVSVAFDTFHDKRNGFIFGANPAGGMMDSAVTNERDSNRDWNTLVDTRTATFDGGWSVEFAIPFKSLRYRPGEQVWGLNVRRIVKWKNEISYLTQVPQGQQAQGGLFRFSSAATLVGVSSPPSRGSSKSSRTAFRRSRPTEHWTSRSRTKRRATSASTPKWVSRRASSPISPTTPTSRRSRTTSSRSTFRASACSSRRNGSSFSRARAFLRSEATRSGAWGTPERSRCRFSAAVSVLTMMGTPSPFSAAAG